MLRIAKRNRYLRAFVHAGATTPATPASLEDVGRRESSVFRSLVRRGLIVEERPGQFYLNTDKARVFQKAERRLALALLALGAIAVATGWAGDSQGGLPPFLPP